LEEEKANALEMAEKDTEKSKEKKEAEKRIIIIS